MLIVGLQFSIIAASKCAQNSVVPPGLDSFLALFPALKRRAKFGHPPGLDSPTLCATGSPQS
jgi:hypothetical protein